MLQSTLTCPGCLRGVAALVVTLLGVACGSPAPLAPEAPATLEPPFVLPLPGPARHGDAVFRWRMKAASVEVARFEMQTRSVADAVRIVSNARVTGVARFVRTFASQAATIVDRASGRTRSSLVEFRGQGKFQRTSLWFDADRVRGARSDGEVSRAFTRRTIANVAPLSADAFLLSLRELELSRGARVVAAVIGTENVWLVELTAETPRVLSTPLGERNAYRLVGRARRLRPEGLIADASEQPLAIHVSADEAALPLRVEANVGASRAIVELVSYEPVL